MSVDVVVEHLGHDDDSLDVFTDADKDMIALVIGAARSKEGSERDITFVSSIGHEDYYVEYVEYREVVERIGADSGQAVNSDYVPGNSLDGSRFLPYSQWNSNIDYPLLFIIIFPVVIVYWLVSRSCRSCRRPSRVHLAVCTLEEIDGAIETARDLIDRGNFWLIHDDLYDTLNAIVNSFNDQSVDVDDNAVLKRWLTRTEAITTLFEKLLSKISNGIRKSKTDNDLEDHLYLLKFLAKIRDVFNVFLEQKKYLHCSCGDPEDRLQNFLLRASESDNTKTIQEALEICRLDKFTTQHGEFISTLTRSLDILNSEKYNRIRSKNENAVSADIDNLHRGLSLALTPTGSLTGSFTNSGSLDNGLPRSLEFTATTISSLDSDTEVLTRQQPALEGLNEHIRMHYAIERSRIQREGERELRQKLSDMDAALQREHECAQLMARYIYDSWKREDEEKRLNAALDKVHESLNDSLFVVTLKDVTESLNKKISSRRFWDRLCLNAVVMCCTIYIFYRAENYGGMLLTESLLAQLRGFCGHVVRTYGAASSDPYLTDSHDVSCGLTSCNSTYDGSDYSWVLYIASAISSKGTINNAFWLKSVSPFAWIFPFVNGIQDLSACALLVLYNSVDIIAFSLLFKLISYIITFGGHNVLLFKKSESVYNTVFLIWTVTSFRHVIASIFVDAKEIFALWIGKSIFLSGLDWDVCNLSLRRKPAGFQYNYLIIRGIFMLLGWSWCVLFVRILLVKYSCVANLQGFNTIT